MTLKQKLAIQIFASAMMIISFIAVPSLAFRIVMVLLFIAHHYVFIFRIKTLRADDANEKWLQAKRRQEKDMLSKMISLYCRKKHRPVREVLCNDCSEIMGYSHERCDSCPHIAAKTSCKRCKTPCYRPDMREKIRTIMSWAGPRIILHHPIAVIRWKFRRT